MPGELEIRISTQTVPDNDSDRVLFALFDFLLNKGEQRTHNSIPTRSIDSMANM